MAVVVREILVCLLLAAALGFAIGWLLRGLRARAAAEAEDARRRAALEELRTQLHVAESARAADGRTLADVRVTSEDARREAEGLRRELREAQQARDAARHDLAGTHHHQAKLSEELDALEAARDEAKAEAVAAENALADTRARIHLIENQRDAARRDAVEHAARSHGSDASRQQLDTLRATLNAAEAGWDTARAQAEAAFNQLGVIRHQLTESETARAGLSAEVAELRARLHDTEAELDQLRARWAVEEKRRSAVPAPPAPLPPSAPRGRERPVRDDLRRIRGVGPVLERLLHRAGVHRYAQIAAWTRDDIAAMADRLPGFPDRIVRERWTAAARRLHIEKYGSPP